MQTRGGGLKKSENNFADVIRIWPQKELPFMTSALEEGVCVCVWKIRRKY